MLIYMYVFLDNLELVYVNYKKVKKLELKNQINVKRIQSIQSFFWCLYVIKKILLYMYMKSWGKFYFIIKMINFYEEKKFDNF